jgi:hypothetical protein
VHGHALPDQKSDNEKRGHDDSHAQSKLHWIIKVTTIATGRCRSVAFF